MNAAFLAVGPAPALANAGQRVEAHPALRASQSVNLGLLSDHPLLADRLHVQESAKGDFVWTGQIRNEPLSRVTLASSDGQLSGVVDRPLRQGGNDVLLIEPQPDGTSLLVRGDAEPLAGPGCPELKVPWPSGSGAGKFSENWPVATAANPAVIDLMILYTPASRARYGASGIQAKILQAVADANIGYQRSQVHITLNLVHMGELSYQESGNMIEALVKLVGDGDGVMDEVHQWRNATSADLVTLVDEDNNYCGISYLMGTPTVEFAPYAFSVVSSGCLNYQTLHHELGHNLGSGHDRANGYGGSYPYSYGFHRCTMDGTSFRTVMAYPCSAGYAPRVNWFSNPNILYNGIPMGVSYELDPANCSDNARSLNQNAHCGAAFRQRPEPAPVAPANLVAFTVAPDRISLAWNDLATNSSGAKVERSPDTLN